MAKNTDESNDLAYAQLKANEGNVSVDDAEKTEHVKGLISGEDVYEGALAATTKSSLQHGATQ